MLVEDSIAVVGRCRSQWVDRRRVVCVPGEITKQTLCLVSRANRQRAELCGLVEEDYHAGARHYVATAAAVGFRLELEIAVDGGADVDSLRGNSKRIDD